MAPDKERVLQQELKPSTRLRQPPDQIEAGTPGRFSEHGALRGGRIWHRNNRKVVFGILFQLRRPAQDFLTGGQEEHVFGRTFGRHLLFRSAMGQARTSTSCGEDSPHDQTADARPEPSPPSSARPASRSPQEAGGGAGGAAADSDEEYRQGILERARQRFSSRFNLEQAIYGLPSAAPDEALRARRAVARRRGAGG